MQRGTTLELTLTGNNLAEPTGLWTSFPARTTIPTAGNNGKDNAKLVVRLEVPADAPVGFGALRLATRRGMSNVRLFCIDDLPQVVSKGNNRSQENAQAVPVPSVVVGRVDAEATDYFKISATAGQRLSFEVLGRRLGSAFDPQLKLFDARTGRELPGSYSNDSPGLQTDARLRYTFKNAGDYLVAVRDVSYRGGEDFHYRLRIGDFPCATAPLPMAARRGAKVTVSFAGPHVEGVAPVDVAVPSDPTVSAVPVAPRGSSGLHGWPVLLAVSDQEEALEKEPNNDSAHANRLTVPAAVTGRLEQKGDVDHYVFALKKGTRTVIESHTTELGSPTEVYMVLRDGKGNQVQASNPNAAARIDFTPGADGDYTLSVEHLHYWGGPEEAYHLTVAPYEPGLDLNVTLDRFNVPQGGTLSLPVQLARRDYNGPIELSVTGAKGLSGKLSIPAGKAGPQALVIKVADDVPPGPLVFHVEGRATINGKAVVRFASVQAPVRQSLANLPLPPPFLLHTVALAVTDKPPLALTARLDGPSYKVGKPATLIVTASRRSDVSGAITLTAAGLPAGVKAALSPIAAGNNEVKITLDLAKAPPGQHMVTITGKGKLGGQEVSAAAAPVKLVIVK
jgi:hypothetical protein